MIVLIAIAGLLSLAVLIILAMKYPQLLFWIFITFFLDIGGYFQNYLDRSLIAGLKTTDVWFAFCFLPLLSSKIRIREMTKDSQFMGFLRFMGFFALFYVLYYGVFVPRAGLNDFLLFLRYQRLSIFGFLILIPTYVITRSNVKLFFRFMVTVGPVVLTLFFLTLFSGLDLIPVFEFERYRGSGILRIGMYNYGYIYFLPFVAITFIILKKRVARQTLMMYGAALMFMTIMITLTRRMIIHFVVHVAWLLYMQARLFPLRHRLGNSVRFGIVVAAAVGLLYLLFPAYIDYILLGFKDVYLVITTGNVSTGQTDGRLLLEIPQQMELVKKHLVFGTGYMWQWHSNDSSIGGLGGADTPFLAIVGMMGVFGTAIYLIFYIKLLRLAWHVFAFLRKNIKILYAESSAIELALLIMFCAYYFQQFITGWPTFFLELINGVYMVITMIYLGIFLALLQDLKQKTESSEVSSAQILKTDP